ncbi:queuine tRNA-ribosyltransferase tRNA-guanine transglycosylase [Natronomonas sp. CBA1123]|uniref:queuine tRNA-ribosyltransferase tRNA-guanine transglycosylase n=1 Tax=Natronomonas sp. CBA1123 TaxID=2668070 RepID=UPI0013097BDA|nr:queuine tRNA-ribosyltransferase tRNA-guanine transglycosylase [Natronomonas sp. CBA1123]MUV85313.1 queuine tRNA-ribosyltransferase tRNA-guanine transglycosylase [Natronomonas sp. CBA1123]
MRFYVPEWDDNVDADYDFVHDEHSSLNPSERNLSYIWDIFDRETTPIDGVLISREQVEDTPSKFERITESGVYDAPLLDIPEWLPTISDCGAWGYKSLPFPPYGNEGMLEFYERLDVTVGVTIDHLVLGSGHTARLYLDERAFPDGFTKSDIPDAVSEEVDVMTDEWPDEWPEYVTNYNPSISNTGDVELFDPDVFEQPLSALLSDLEAHPHAVYRDDDMAFRYDLTLTNAREMKDLYNQGDYSFRLMVAIQGWNSRSYADAAERVLDMGYQYLGIGGVAGSPEEAVKDYVTAVGRSVKDFERAHDTRIDTHVFGFAKTGAFDTIGKSGMTSFDSASMLRAAWTGGDNYHLDSDQRYDAIRVRYPPNGASVEEAVEKALRAQEMLHALRAFDADESISQALTGWHRSAVTALESLEPYLREHRHDNRFDHSTLRPIKQAFRDDYEYGHEVSANFSGKFRGDLAKLLRMDSHENPLPFEEYQKLISRARDVFGDWTPTNLEEIQQREKRSGEYGTFDQLWVLVANYTAHVGDENLRDQYEELLRREPWNDCDCRICEEHGIEVAIFRGNNRNRRRGFHNTRRFYDEFERDLPKTAILTRGGTGLSNTDTVEEFLRANRSEFWKQVHDLPVAEIGTVTASGIHEWWADSPSTISFAPRSMREALEEFTLRYQELFIDGSSWTPDEELMDAVREADCEIHVINEPGELRTAVLERLGYEPDFVPDSTLQSGLTEY